MAVAAARLRAKLAGDPDPAGPATGRVLASFRRRIAAAACTAAMLAAVFATAAGVVSAERAAALERRDVTDAREESSLRRCATGAAMSSTLGARVIGLSARRPSTAVEPARPRPRPASSGVRRHKHPVFSVRIKGPLAGRLGMVRVDATMRAR